MKAKQKMIALYKDKDIEMVKHCCTLPNQTNICLYESTDAKFYPFTEEDKEFLENPQVVVGGSPIVFTRKAIVDETFIRKPTNLFKFFVRSDASQFYRLYTRWDFNSETGRFTPQQNKTRRFEERVTFFFQGTRPECKIENFYARGRQKKNDCFCLMGFIFLATLWADFINFVPSLTMFFSH